MKMDENKYCKADISDALKLKGYYSADQERLLTNLN